MAHPRSALCLGALAVACSTSRHAAMEMNGAPPMDHWTVHQQEDRSGPVLAQVGTAQEGHEHGAVTSVDPAPIRQPQATGPFAEPLGTHTAPAVPEKVGPKQDSLRTNHKAVASFPVAAATWGVALALQSTPILLIGGVIAFALGLIGSRQLRDRGGRGRGWGLAGMVLGAAAMFIGTLALIF